MFENLRKLYLHYGGLTAILKSSYFWLALVLACVSYNSVWDRSWVEVALAVLPSLAGFTLAAFAIIFAILDNETLEKLIPFDAKGKSPVLSVTAAIGHAVLIQVSSLLLAVIFSFVEMAQLSSLSESVLAKISFEEVEVLPLLEFMANLFSALGLLLTFYGVLLVLAAILSIFRMQLLVASSKKKLPPKS